MPQNIAQPPPALKKRMVCPLYIVCVIGHVSLKFDLFV